MMVHKSEVIFLTRMMRVRPLSKTVFRGFRSGRCGVKGVPLGNSGPKLYMIGGGLCGRGQLIPPEICFPGWLIRDWESLLGGYGGGVSGNIVVLGEVEWGGFFSTLTVFSRLKEEEKIEPGEVANCLLSWGTLLVGDVQGDGGADEYGSYSGRWRLLFLVGFEMLSQAKVELEKPVVL